MNKFDGEEPSLVQMLQAELGDVEPIKQDQQVSQPKAIDRDSPELVARRKAAVEDVSVADKNYLSTEYVDMVDPYDEIMYKKDGIQWGVFKKLKHGQYNIEARLDLHRMSIETARREVFQFIRESREYDLRSVLITHGKGDRSDKAKAILKSYTAKWLKELDEVLAYHSAQKHHGGVGSVYVLIKKSDLAKGENRERHGGKH